MLSATAQEEPSMRIIYEQCLYRPGDYGSSNWRIPAIIYLKDGSLLATCDKRKQNEGDLPEDIDIVARRSRDGGLTWGEPVTIAEGEGRKRGYGDAALVESADGDVLCLFVGGNGLWTSTEEEPQRSYVCRSSDGGATWSEPTDITSLLWGSRATNPSCREYRSSFFASGNGLRLRHGRHAGRIMTAAAMCRKEENILDNYVVYSDDNGATWTVSGCAYRGGDEAKLTELSDGKVLISVRQQGTRGWNISADGGETWGEQGLWEELTANACNGEILRVSDTLLIHSLPHSMRREKVSLFTSHDDGKSWHHALTLYEGPSVYSSMTLMPDGRIAILMERNPDGACEIWFQIVEIEKRGISE